MPITLTLPTDGQSDWDVPLNQALTDLETAVNDQETAIGDKLDTSAAAELIRDTMGAALVAGTNVTVTVDDGANTITIASSGGGLDAEGVRDTIAAALVAGTGVTIDVDDSGDTITINATGGGSVPDATDTVKGVVQLAGDLAGTAAAPTVPGLADKLDASTRGLYAGINAQTGTTYAPVLTDQGKLVTLTNAGAITVTLPSDATTAFPIGAQIDFIGLGAGLATFAAGSGATLHGTPTLVTRAQYSAVTLIKVSTNGWVAVGDLA